MDFIEVIKKRRSVRNFSSRQIDDEIIQELMECARLAPSGGNGQNWCFGIVREEALKKDLAKAAGMQEWIATAPVVIACCAIIEGDLSRVPRDDFGLIVNNTRFGEAFIGYMNEYPDRWMMNIFWNNSVPLIPGEHIFLAAVNRGLSACWVGYLDINKASQILDLPEYMSCLFLMPIGYPDEEVEDIKRKSYEDIVFYEKWSKGE